MVMAKKRTKRFWVLYGVLGCLVLLAVAIMYKINTRPTTPVLADPPLNELAARHGIKLGNFAILNHLHEKPYADILTTQFDFVLADNTPNWYFTDGGLRPSRTSYNFENMDKVMLFAEQNDMPVQAHHYVWGEEKWLPDWLKNGGFSKQELMDIMQDHITTVGQRYQGRIAEWTVVNEAFSRLKHPYDLHDWWADSTGSLDYVDSAFKWAREADPKAKLLLNDFNNESINSISNDIYDYVKSAQTRGVPIDGIGMQMHIDGAQPPSKDEMIQNMQRFADLGLGIYVTEFDVNMNEVHASPSVKDQMQGDIYYDAIRACIESKVCYSFAYLGITDGETWYNHIGLKDPRPLMFDRRYKPKQAYYSTRDALSQP